MAIPMVALGGRNDEGANESTLERLGCAAAGIKMLMSYPFTGVGYTQYTEYHPLTAHNAYILAAGELGLPGMWLFGVLIYLAIKVPVTVIQFEMSETPETIQIKALAMGMLAALIGGAIGIFFLSWCYHFVLWIHFGMVGALYACVKRQFPTYECKLSRKEGVRILLGYVCFVIFWAYYIRVKGAWE
jgi:O-antigen ligase